MNIQLSDHFDYGRLLRFTLPSIVMMIFTSVYSVVDGFFISNFVGITEFSAINLIMPLNQMLGCMGFMFGTGGAAYVSMTLGSDDRVRANRVFSMITYIAIGTGLLLAALGVSFIEPVAVWMGADAELLPYCLTYGRILLAALPAFMLQILFQSFLVTAEKPGLGLVVTVATGLTNIVLDAVFILVCEWGIAGAAAATSLAQCIGGVVPLVYFARSNSSLLRLGRLHWDGAAMFHSCTNGMSELVTNISMSLVSMLYNFQLMELAGSHGVAAYGAVMYVSFVFVAVFIGYSIGVAPVIGFHYGAENHDELKSLYRKSLRLVTGAEITLAVAALLLAQPLAEVFVGQEPVLAEMTVTAFRWYALSVLFSGYGIFGSAFFTALNDGVVSAAISFLRTLVFQVAAVLILPVFFKLDGIWYSLFTAEMLAAAVTAYFFAAKRAHYHY